MGTGSSQQAEPDEETRLTKLPSSEVFKRLVVCGSRDSNVNQKLKEHQIIETKGKQQLFVLTSKRAVGLRTTPLKTIIA